jgi:hypothetical protein
VSIIIQIILSSFFTILLGSCSNNNDSNRQDDSNRQGSIAVVSSPFWAPNRPVLSRIQQPQKKMHFWTAASVPSIGFTSCITTTATTQDLEILTMAEEKIASFQNESTWQEEAHWMSF